MKLLSITSSIFFVYRMLPGQVRFSLKSWFRVNGHGTSFFDRAKAKRDAEEKKSVDAAMQTLVSTVCKSGIKFENINRALEVGAGYVPSDVLCYYILGISEAVATDYNRIADFQMLKHALDISEDCSILAAARPLDDGHCEQRLQKLRRCFDGTEESLQQLGITYIAPLDLSSSFTLKKFDFIHSVCVFEHIPPNSVPFILKNLTESLSEIGVMLHDIHLRDHRDIEKNPFEFLKIDSDYIKDRDTDKRGNLIRFSEWVEIFGSAPNLITQVVSKEVQKTNLPSQKDLRPRFSSLQEEDCFTSHLVLKSMIRSDCL